MYPYLSEQPSGKGAPVMILPGFGAGDQSTAMQRYYIEPLGSLDEVLQEDAGDRRIDGGPGHGVFPCDLKRCSKQLLELGGLHRVVLDRARHLFT